MKTIVFVRNGASPRLFNEAYALKQSGKYKLILICKTFDSKNMGFFNTVFDEIIFFQHALFQHILNQNINDSLPIYSAKFVMNRHLIQPIMEYLSDWNDLPTILKKLDADLFNCCGSGKETYDVLQNTDCPVVMDLHNGTSALGVERLSMMQLSKDMYCYKQVSGIIHRGGKRELPYYRKHGYEIECPVFVFEDYCNRLFFANGDKKLSSEDGAPHFVNMGGGFSSPYVFLTLKKFIKQKIHFHLYLTPHARIAPFVFKRYIKLNKSEKYFHLEEPVPIDEIHNEISKYDFGSLVQVSEYFNQYEPEYLKFGSAYRLFTYLEGGLPVLVSDRLHLIKKTVVENKVGFSIKDGQLDILRVIIDCYDYKQLRKNVFRARKELLIDNHVDRLVNFYDRITNH